MKTPKYVVAAAQIVFIFPAVLFMGALVLRYFSALPNEAARTAQQIVMWYAGRMWTLWVLLFALPLGVLVTGCITFARSRSEASSLPSGRLMLAAIHSNREMLIVAVMTLLAGAILTIVGLHVLAN